MEDVETSDGDFSFNIEAMHKTANHACFVPFFLSLFVAVAVVVERDT